MLTCYPVCNKAEGFDWFLYWIIAGCPFGIRRMCLWLIPKNFGISGSIGVLALNCIIGGLIGGVVLIFKIIGIAGELISIVKGHFWTKSPKVEIWNFWTFCPKVGQSEMAALLLSEGRSRKIYGVNERCGQSNGTGG